MSNTSFPATTVSIDDPSGIELVRLRDGSSVAIRPACAQDEPALRSFLMGLCLEARRLRFFSEAVDIRSAAHLAATTNVQHCGLIEHDEESVLVGHATYVQLDELLNSRPRVSDEDPVTALIDAVRRHEARDRDRRQAPLPAA
jgi:hypothetical protein